MRVRSVIHGLLTLALLSAFSGAAFAMPTTSVRVGDTSISFVDRGRGEPILLVHGGLQDYRLWTDVLPTLSERRRVVAYSRRNHWPGPVAPDGTPDGAADLHGEDIAAFLRATKLGRVHVVAHSAGAHAALFFAAQHPEMVRSLVLNEPPAAGVLTTEEARGVLAGFQAQLQPAMAAFRDGEVELGLRRFADAVGGPGGYERRTAAQLQMMRDNALAHVADATTSRPRPVFTCEMAKRIAAPVLITRGDRSPAYFHAVADALARCLPNVRQRTLSASHNGPGEDPGGFAAAVNAFLAAQ